jgi:hypothetical protein
LKVSEHMYDCCECSNHSLILFCGLASLLFRIGLPLFHSCLFVAVKLSDLKYV